MTIIEVQIKCSASKKENHLKYFASMLLFLISPLSCVLRILHKMYSVIQQIKKKKIKNDESLKNSSKSNKLPKSWKANDVINCKCNEKSFKVNLRKYKSFKAEYFFLMIFSCYLFMLSCNYEQKLAWKLQTAQY